MHSSELNKKSIQLASCPHCGNTQIDFWDEADDFYYCEKCGLCGPRAHDKILAADRWNALPRRLPWTQEKPTVEGMYWCRCIDPCRRIAGPANVMYYTHGCTLIEMYDEFAGPIPEPEEQ